MINYKQHLKLDENYIIKKIKEFLDEDIPDYDVTTNGTVDPDIKITALIQAEQDLIFAGEKIIPHFFNPEKIDEIKINYKDGEFVKNKEYIAVVMGNASELLIKERQLLNLIQRLCGIATKTKEYVKIAKPYGVRVLDTRKTTPGLRLFEKYAVAVGGGTNHRLDLSSGILIKDNHIEAAGSITKAVERVRKIGTELPIEVEVETFEQIYETLSCKVDGLLLDNMTPEKTKNAVDIVRNNENGKEVMLESSGGITLDTIELYCKAGIDAVSVGALTHSVKSADIHIEFE